MPSAQKQMLLNVSLVSSLWCNFIFISIEFLYSTQWVTHLNLFSYVNMYISITLEGNYCVSNLFCGCKHFYFGSFCIRINLFKIELHIVISILMFFSFFKSEIQREGNDIKCLIHIKSEREREKNLIYLKIKILWCFYGTQPT